MGEAVLCPVCAGKGNVRRDGWTVTCNGCGGKGWVELSKPKGEGG